MKLFFVCLICSPLSPGGQASLRSSSLHSSSLHRGPTVRQALCQGWGHVTFGDDDVPASGGLLVGSASKRYISKRCSGQDSEGVRWGRAREGGRRGLTARMWGARGLLRVAAEREPAGSGQEWSRGREPQAPRPRGGHELGVFENRKGALGVKPFRSLLTAPQSLEGWLLCREPEPRPLAWVQTSLLADSPHLGTSLGALGRQKRHSGCLRTAPR